MSMESTTTEESPQASLSLPWKPRIALNLLSIITNASLRENGTVNRFLLKLVNFRTPATKSKSINGVASHDVVVDEARNLWFRVYVPTQHVNTGEDLPVMIFFHGGGFVYLSADAMAYDAVCRRFATTVPAVVVSVNYRLAPEHRYPAAHDDCFDVLKFLDDDENRSKSSLPENARCFLAGDSAGGNLAHHVAQRASEFTFQRLKVIGVVAIQPFFGGEERTESEIRLDGTPSLSIKRTDWYWKAFLPQGEGLNRDHPIVNVSGPMAVDISEIDFPATMVVVGGFDILHDWGTRYYEWMKKSGKEVYLFEYPNMFHAFYVFSELPEAGQLIGQVRDFIHKVSSIK